MAPALSATSDEERRHRPILFAGVLATMLARFLVTRDAVGPQVVADESAYLAMARHLAGVGEPWNLGPAAAYSPGYSIVIAPLFRIVSDPVLLFRSIVGVNILLGGLLVLAYESLTRRLTTLTRPTTVLVATAAASLPALVVTSNHAWSDALTPLVFAGVMVAGIRALDRPTAARALVLAASVGAAHLTHTRLLVLGLPVGALLLALAWNRRIRWTVAIGSSVLMLASVIVSSQITAWAQEPIYPPGWDGSKSVRSDLIDRVLSGGPFVLSTAGQLWYLLATTAGIAGLGILVLARAGGRTGRARTRGSAPGVDPEAPNGERTGRLADLGLADRLPALLYVGTSMGLCLGVSIAFMTDRERSDQLVYGRYNEAFLGILVVLGLASLLAARATIRRRIVDLAVIGGVLVGSGGLIWWKRLDLLQTRGATSTVLGLMALSRDPVQSPRRVTLVAVLLLLLIGAAALLPRRRATAVGLLLVILVPLGIDRAVGPLALHGSRKAVAFTSARDLFERGDVLWFAQADGGESSQFYRIPFYIDRITVDRRAEGNPWIDGPEFLMASKGTPRAPAEGYRKVWEHPDSDLAIWVAPGARQDVFAREGRLVDDADRSLAPTGS